MRGLQGRRVLISGGSSGIGLATARRFLEEGSRVVLTGLDPREVDSALAGASFIHGAALVIDGGQVAVMCGPRPATDRCHAAGRVSQQRQPFRKRCG
jgi:NAD(P)-dependent dehydrogenase (short-subunit alcohol dehydrogenase family)